MNFLHPWAIGLGAATLLLPVAIHFLTRPRPQSMPLSTIRFVQQAIKQRRAKSWLRDILVLLLRAVAIACLAWAFAQPLFHAQPAEVADANASLQRIVILDASQSMGAMQSGVDGFQAARVQVSRYLKPDPKVRANLIIAAAEAVPVFESASSNMGVLSESLAETGTHPERIDVQAAINAAAEMLISGSEEQQRELVIVSDFQRANWATVDFSPLPKTTKIKLESTAPQETPDNVAVLAAGFSEKPRAGSHGILEITLGNYSNRPRNLQIEVSLGDSVFVMEANCPPKVQTVVTHELLIPAAGWQAGQVKLLKNEDALVSDDNYPFVVQTIDTPSCTIVTRQSPSQRPSSSFFLETALAPSEQVAGQMQVDRIGAARFGVDAVAGSQLLVFDHPGRLQADQIKSLASLIRRGRGVLYMASELVDATNLKLLYEELGTDLRAPIAFSPPPRGSHRKSLTISSVQSSRRPFSVFGDSLDAMLTDLRIGGGLATHRIPGTLDDDVLATLSDQSVLLFTAPAGLGNLCVFNVDLDESNLPRHPTFVPIINELVDSLMRSNRQAESTFCGEPLTRLLPASITSTEGLTFAKIDDAARSPTDAGEFRSSGDGVIWNWRRPMGPGTFQVMQNEQPVYAIATHIPPEESDLRTLDPEVITQRLAGDRDVNFNRIADAESERDNGWIWFAIAAVTALIGEVVVLNRFKT